MLRLLVQIILSAKFFNLCPIFKYDTVERLYTVPQCLSVPGTSIYRAYDFHKPLVISQSCSYHFWWGCLYRDAFYQRRKLPHAIVHIFIQPLGVGTEQSVLSNCPTSDFETCFQTLISSCLSTRDQIFKK